MLGVPTCAVIAKQNPGIQVTVVDLSEARIAAWKSNALPIFEPDLFSVVEVARDGTDGRAPNLHFSTDIAAAIDEADLIFIAVNTPTKTAGLGAGKASNLAYVESAARMIAEAATSDKIVVEKSTVPCGTAESLRTIFAALAPSLTFDILSNPEFLAEGTAISDLLRPDRILIGSLNDARSKSAAEALAQVYTWVPRSQIITVNIWSSELAKLAANCMLAQRISSINSLSAICEATGAEIEELAQVVGLDSRIGDRMLKASAGFGGSCFKKDVLSLVYIAESLHLEEVAAHWKTVVDLNEYQKNRFARRITRALHNTLADKRIAILGWAYKKNTRDTRESAAITIAGQLLAEGALLAIYDPLVSQNQILQDLADVHPNADSVIKIYSDATAACVDACAVVIMTEWDEFKADRITQTTLDKLADSNTHDQQLESTSTSSSSDSGIDVQDDTAENASDSPAPGLDKRIDWRSIAAVVRRPRLVFDGRNVVDADALASLGFRVQSIGKADVF
ncbi:hypothetical protein LTR36_005032 [Oleoguttula mirabilis]|uniref:UDP-glucose 6-dehydrogenase n=1 Tax=Oleoguttula mirabilis TaxID=1507867 RepID=A0AAV9JWL6_9PEZI|nr:hypothetical protein LTR36_005032 [Oleoguttula mirabilis]